MESGFAQSLCRTCMAENGEFESLTQGNLIHILQECTSIKVNLKKEPSTICFRCKSTLLTFYDFKNKSLAVDKIIRNQVESQNGITPNLEIKVEHDNTLGNFDEDLDDKLNIDRNTKSKRSITPEVVEQKLKTKKKKRVVSLESKKSDKVKIARKRQIEPAVILEDELNKIDVFVCIHCTKVFITKQRLSNHVNECHPDKTKDNNVITCKHCEKSLKGIRGVVNHYKAEHRNKNAEIKCNRCRSVFHEQYQLANHFDSSHSENTCNVCGKVIRKGLRLLRVHLKNHARYYLKNKNLIDHYFTIKEHELDSVDEEIECTLREHYDNVFDNKRKKYKCEYCPKTFKNRKIWRTHQLTHTSSNLFECNACGRKYYQLNQLTTHYKNTQHAEPTFKCEECGQTFYLELALQKHVEKHFDGRCRLCGIPIKDYRKYRKHLYRVHKSNTSFHCKDCDITFKRKETFNAHIAKDHEGQDLRKICTICGDKFLDLNMHMHIAHKIGERTFRCRRCDQTFDDVTAQRKHQYLVHKKNHSPDEYTQTCPICEKRFLTKLRLDGHLKKMHNPNRVPKYVCNLCNVELKNKQKYEYHMTGHTGERPYECGFCELKFRCKKGLTAHTRRHTGEKPHKCKICGMAFMHFNTYSAHKKLHYGKNVFVKQDNPQLMEGSYELSTPSNVLIF